MNDKPKLSMSMFATQADYDKALAAQSSSPNEGVGAIGEPITDEEIINTSYGYCSGDGPTFEFERDELIAFVRECLQTHKEAGIPSEPVAWMVKFDSAVENLYTTDPRDVEHWQNQLVNPFEVTPLYAAPIPSVPPGYKLVPVEPTEAMVFAWIASQKADNTIEAGYRAMLAGAPAVPAVPDLLAVADAERKRIAEHYERSITNNTCEVGGHVNRQWAHLEGAVKVVQAIRRALGTPLVAAKAQINTHLAAEAGGTDNRLGAVELLPCAHCGGKAEIDGGYSPVTARFAACETCGINTDLADDAEAAANIWNRRAATAVPSGDGLGAVEVPAEILRIGELLGTQDNRYTDQPMFLVQQKRRVTGFDPEYGQNIVWLHAEGDYTEADAEEAARFDAQYNATGEEPHGWIRTGYQDQWEFVTACFTEQGCKDYLELNGHNLRKETRIYADGSYRNQEFQFIRKWLMSLTSIAPEPTHEAENSDAQKVLLASNAGSTEGR